MENNDNSVTEAQILKRSDPQYVFSFITRELNLINDGNKEVKKNSIQSLYNFIVVSQPSLKRELIQELLITNNSKIIKFAFFDPIDKVREYSMKILISSHFSSKSLLEFLKISSRREDTFFVI